MMKGLVKKDCNDPDDEGTFCWSDNTQAFVIGAYFYGYAAQAFTAFIAKRFTGIGRHILCQKYVAFGYTKAKTKYEA